ncbi:hypothetical protein MTYM_01642 [Methylococcales bacterium]|nr:hypothetical protein MTYM_01642 [Methylococcales bacterium]
MKKSSKAKFIILTICIIFLGSLFIIHYFSGKRTLPPEYSNTEASQTKPVKEVSSDPFDQIKEYGELMNEWTNVVTEMNSVLEDVKSTVQKETVANK